MAKAKKAPQKKMQSNAQSNRGLKVASGIFVAIGLLVVISMIVSSVFTQTAPVVSAPVPTAVFTAVPTAAP